MAGPEASAGSGVWLSRGWCVGDVPDSGVFRAVERPFSQFAASSYKFKIKEERTISCGFELLTGVKEPGAVARATDFKRPWPAT